MTLASDRVVGRDCRRCRLRRVADGRARRDRSELTARSSGSTKTSAGRDRRIVAGRCRRSGLRGRSRRSAARGRRRDGKAAWTFKTGGELKSSPVVAGDRVLIGSYDTHLYAAGAKDGKLRWKVQTDGYVHATPAVVNGVAYVTGCDEILRGIRIADGKEVLNVASGAYTGASPAIAEGRAYYGTYDNEVLGVDLKSRKILWRYKRPTATFPSIPPRLCPATRIIVGGRDKLVHAIDRQTGKAADLYDPRARRLFARRCRRARLCRIERRQAYVLDAAERQEPVRVRGWRPLSASPAVASGRSSSDRRTASCSASGGRELG